MLRRHSPFYANFFFVLALSAGLFSCKTGPFSQRSERPSWATPYYFSALPFTISTTVPHPPADGTLSDDADLRTLMEWQARRTPADCAAARIQEIPTLRTLFGRKEVGDRNLPDFTKMELEKLVVLTNFFEKFHRDISFVNYEAKEHFTKRRPFDRKDEVQPCIKLEKSFTYPSGHAAIGAAGAEVLKEIFPKRKTALRKAGLQAGYNRIIGGVHYPSDVEAGAELGRKAYKALRALPAFQADLNAVKKALR